MSCTVYPQLLPSAMRFFIPQPWHFFSQFADFLHSPFSLFHVKLVWALFFLQVQQMCHHLSSISRIPSIKINSIFLCVLFHRTWCMPLFGAFSFYFPVWLYYHFFPCLPNLLGCCRDDVLFISAVFQYLAQILADRR